MSHTEDHAADADVKVESPCQIAHRERYPLVCSVTDGGGFFCENPAPDHGSDHWISAHTIDHAIAGNGYACSAFAAS